MAVDKLVDSAQLDAALTATADAIRAKTGSAVSLPWNLSTGFQSSVEAIPTGGSATIPESDVNFYDYDGTVIASYTASDFAALTALPDNPTHNGLTAQGWNWTLADAKAYVSKYGKLNIGQMYITDDGKNRVYIHLEDGQLAPYLGIAVNGTATIDWGDGTTDTITGSSISENDIIVTQHVYTDAGDYVIEIDVIDGEIRMSGSSGAGSKFVSNNKTAANQNLVYQSIVTKIELGTGITAIGSYMFNNFVRLRTVTIPANVTTIGLSALYSCYSLVSLVVPKEVTTISNNFLYNCYSAKCVSYPNSVTTIGTYAHQNNYTLTSITMPDSVTSIGDYAFSDCKSLSYAILFGNFTNTGNNQLRNCSTLSAFTIYPDITTIGSYFLAQSYSLSRLYVYPSTPPALNSNALTNISIDCIIYVPAGKLETYQSANIWSTYANRMQEMGA